MLKLRPLARKFVEMRQGVEVWKFSGSKYSVAVVWEELREKQEKVSWHRFLWRPMAIPKHVFITWMAILNRLPTMDRLKAWGIEMGELCSFCQDSLETRNHIFFCCSYSKTLWKHILLLCGLHREVGNWEEEISWAVRRIKGKSLISVILSTAWKAYIYHVWQERNRRLHSKLPSSPEQILEQIKEEIRIRLTGLKVANDDVNRHLSVNWGLSNDILV